MREARTVGRTLLSRGRTCGVRPGRPKDAKRSLTTTGHASTCATLSRTSGGIPRARVVFLSTWWRRTRLSWRYRASPRAVDNAPSRVSRIGKFDGRAFALHRAAAAFLRGCDTRFALACDAPTPSTSSWASATSSCSSSPTTTGRARACVTRSTSGTLTDLRALPSDGAVDLLAALSDSGNLSIFRFDDALSRFLSVRQLRLGPPGVARNLRTPRRRPASDDWR